MKNFPNAPICVQVQKFLFIILLSVNAKELKTDDLFGVAGIVMDHVSSNKKNPKNKDCFVIYKGSKVK